MFTGDFKTSPYAHKQAGIVLPVALVTLVAATLLALGFVRANALSLRIGGASVVAEETQTAAELLLTTFFTRNPFAATDPRVGRYTEAKAMRQLMLNHARDRLAAKRGGGAQQVTLDDNDLAADAQAEHLVMLDSALQRLADEDERLAKAVECRVFAGLSEQETADAMEMPLRSSQRLFAEARQRLAHILGDAGAGG